MPLKQSWKKILTITSIIYCCIYMIQSNNRIRRILDEKTIFDENNLRLTLVISHCDEDMSWMKEFLQEKENEVQNVTIYSKCNSNINGYSPPGTEIKQLPNFGRCDHTYAHWMSEMKEEDATDNHLVVFLKATRNKDGQPGMSYRSFHDMIRIANVHGFACGYENSGLNYTNTPLLTDVRGYARDIYKGKNIKSPYANMGEWLDSMGMVLPTPTTPVCYGGHFVAKASQIYSKQNIIKKVEQSLMRGDSVEEGHFSERAWAGLLSYPINLNHQIETVQERSLSETMPKVLTYITTQLSPAHKEYIQYCWPSVLKHSKLLSSSDIMVFYTPLSEDPKEIEDSSQLLKDVFKNQKLTIQLYKNPGLVEGAIAAMSEGSRNGWFDDYDWVFRMNADVIIQDDSWMLDTITNHADDVSLMYVECQPHLLPYEFANVKKIMTDFFAVKISDVPKGNFEINEGRAAETEFTYAVRPIVEAGKHRHIPDAFPLVNSLCRINGNTYGSVVHYHHYRYWMPTVENGVCPAIFPEHLEGDNTDDWTLVE